MPEIAHAPDSLRVVAVNLAYDAEVASAAALLRRYLTLAGWSRAMTRAGASVQVVQRFAADDIVDADGVGYMLVGDGPPGRPGPWEEFVRVLDAVRRAAPVLVHVNGLMFPGMVRALRAALPRAAIVLQDHSGWRPRVPVWPLNRRTSARWAAAFRDADACTFTAAVLAAPWHAVGLPPDMPVLEIPEASTELRPLPRAEAARATGIAADPALLWVGRLDANKDPLTVLDALDAAFPLLPRARCWMVYPDSADARGVRRRIDRSPLLRERVTLVGAVAHDRLASDYSAADIFVSGSHHEGSGYALLEAMACGVVPCVTDIPAFRALLGPSGARWAPGDAAACARALVTLAHGNVRESRERVRQRFDEALSWDEVGRRTLAAYRGIAARRGAAAGAR